MSSSTRSRLVTPTAGGRGGQGRGWSVAAARWLGGVTEATVLVMVALAPWAFGAVEPRFEFLLDTALGLVAVLWGAQMVLRGRLPRPGPVAACLVTIVLIGVVQGVSLPTGWLARLAPGTAQLYGQLLPDRPEVLPGGGVARDDPEPRPGTTLSLDPGATRRQALRLVGVLLLFAATADGFASAASLRRLSRLALINGAILALFGLVQSFSTDDPGLVYWSVPTAGAVFGPFVNRNHFAFHENLCIGLALGGLLARSAGDPDRREAGWARSGLDLLRDPVALGMILGLALMVGSTVFSLSRGGFLALLGGGVLGLGIWVRQPMRAIRGGPLLVGAAAVLALASWFGFESVATRLETLRGSDVLADRRMAVLQRSLLLVRDFPLWGTGYGTFELVDELHRGDAADAGVFFDHAHDDYLEVLVEGGLIQLLPSLLAIGLVVGSGWRVLRGSGDQATRGLVLGAMVAFATTLIHGFTDFGLHIPANTVLVTVVTAQIVAIGRATRVIDQPTVKPSRRIARHLLAVGGAVGAVALGGLVVVEGWRHHEARRLRAEAAHSGEVFDAASRRRKVAALAAAARLIPDNARTRGELMTAYLEAYNQQLAEQTEQAGAANPPSPINDPLLVAALRELRRARDLSPLRVASHLDLATHAGQFAHADSPDAYRDRARWLAPGDPEVWYRCGAAELASGQLDRAWASWRHSLTLSSRRLTAILDEATPLVSPRDLVRLVLPNDPGQLMAAADHLASGPPEARRPILEAARSLLIQRKGLTPKDYHLQATIGRTLGLRDEAAAALRAALARAPMQHTWRLELAEVLRDQGLCDEARQEVLVVLGLQPGDDRARALLDAITRQIAEGQ